jgi:hypothetical protein
VGGRVGKYLNEAPFVSRQRQYQGVLWKGEEAQQQLEDKAVGDLDRLGDRRA